MQIQVIGLSKPEWKEKGKAKWQEAVLTFISAGKTQTKKFLSFDPIFSKVKEMEGNEQYEIVLEKDGEYWKWTSATKQTSSGVQSSPDTPKQMSRPSTYETAEERAKKQVYIIRQSSLANAIEYSKSVKALKSKEELFDVANSFVEFVINEKQGMDALLEMEDNVPL